MNKIRNTLLTAGGSAALFLTTALSADDVLRQNLGNGDLLMVTEADASLPGTLIQATPRMRSYHDGLMDAGFHFRTGTEIIVPTHIRMQDLNASQIVGAHGEGTVVRYKGRWEGDGGNAFPHMVLTEGARFVFTEESQMDMVMAGSFFTRQLWVWGDGTGIIELEEGFNADQTVNEPVPDAMGTIRLGGATLITHHTRNMPANTRPDGRGGHYQNGHIVFERVPGNRWIVDTSNQEYGAQLDFDTDAIVETRAALTHIGHRRIVLPVGPGGHFRSSGAFRTTSPDVTITKTGPAMLALEGEQSYHPGSRLVVEEGLLRMATDPGLGRDPDARGNAGVYLQMEVKNEAGAHFIGTLHRLQSFVASDQSGVWIDDGVVVSTREGFTTGPEVPVSLSGVLEGASTIEGRLHLSGTAVVENLISKGTVSVSYGPNAPAAPSLHATESLRLEGDLTVRFWDRRGRVPEEVLLIRAPESELANLSGAFSGTHTCSNDRFTFDLEHEGGEVWMRNITAIQE